MKYHQYQRIALSLKTKRDALEERTSGSVFSQVIQRKGWRRVNEDLKDKIYTFIRNHCHVVESPIASDLVTISDKNDPTNNVRVPKLLLQITIRCLHNYFPQQVPEATDLNGKALISDLVLGRILPKELWIMSNCYKIMCACIDRQSIHPHIILSRLDILRSSFGSIWRKTESEINAFLFKSVASGTCWRKLLWRHLIGICSSNFVTLTLFVGSFCRKLLQGHLQSVTKRHDSDSG